MAFVVTLLDARQSISVMCFIQESIMISY